VAEPDRKRPAEVTRALRPRQMRVRLARPIRGRRAPEAREGRIPEAALTVAAPVRGAAALTPVPAAAMGLRPERVAKAMLRKEAPVPMWVAWLRAL
jgi:hypothetical protein